MQENDENTVNQKDEMPSQDTAHEYPDQEGASVPAEDDGNESRSRPNRGKTDFKGSDRSGRRRGCI